MTNQSRGPTIRTLLSRCIPQRAANGSEVELLYLCTVVLCRVGFSLFLDNIFNKGSLPCSTIPSPFSLFLSVCGGEDFFNS
uniref:Uncharacterized protein n=1 Tax=Salix viminalis TaxID=40686 RepID=A0A6N2M0A9_SALVM